MEYRPSKRFVLTVLPLAALGVSLGFGLLPELKEFEVRPIPGAITFKSPKPATGRDATISSQRSVPFRLPLEWIEENYESLMSWEYNPWKRPAIGFGDHYFKLQSSKNPLDQAKCRELQRLAEASYQRLLLRFPELAVTLRNVPNERNGFLKWLDFSDKFKVPSDYTSVVFPKDLDDYLNHQGSWNQEAAKTWLAGQKPLLDEIRTIGLMPERSVNGIPVESWGFTTARLARSCEQALIVEARLAAEMGDVAAALETTRAARGFADLFSEVESPSLLSATVHILLQSDLEHRVLHEILPALPAGEMDPAAWEAVLKPTVYSPAEFARLMKGEWSVGSRQFLLPMLLDAADPKCPPDAAELLDAYSLLFLEIARVHETADLKDLPTLAMPPALDTSHLSRTSRQAVESLSIGFMAWRKGWDRSQSSAAFTQAAFAIMKNQPIPKDPVYGQDYRWDPATRQLSMPAGKAFDDLGIKPITVPKP